MNSYIYLKAINPRKESLIIKLRQLGINIYELEEEDNNLIIKINIQDYAKIKKYLKTIRFKKIRYTGPKYFLETFKRFKIIFISIILSWLLIWGASFIIVDVKIVHDDETLVNLLENELEKYGIKKFSLRQNYEKLSQIKEEIKRNNLDTIDWLEINKVGMKYIVRVEKRVITPQNEEKDYCHFIATKDGIITKMMISKGEAKVFQNDYVKKGDVLISGDVLLNESVVDKVCASGKAYAEVWYTVNVKVPLEYTENKATGKMRNNIIINYDGVDHKLFKDRLQNFTSTKKLIFNGLGIQIYLKKDEEMIKEYHKYTVKEAEEKALRDAKEKVELKMGPNDKIISQKVLQKTVNDSTIDIDIFMVVEEDRKSVV